MNHKLNTDKTALVATDHYWISIDADTPLGVKMLLINQKSGVAWLGYWSSGDSFWTHYSPLPMFKKD